MEKYDDLILVLKVLIEKQKLTRDEVELLISRGWDSVKLKRLQEKIKNL